MKRERTDRRKGKKKQGGRRIQVGEYGDASERKRNHLAAFSGTKEKVWAGHESLWRRQIFRP